MHMPGRRWRGGELGVAAHPPRTNLALCAGIGGLELGLRAVWPDMRTVCFVERDRYAALVLARRMLGNAVVPAQSTDGVRELVRRLHDAT